MPTQSSRTWSKMERTVMKTRIFYLYFSDHGNADWRISCREIAWMAKTKLFLKCDDIDLLTWIKVFKMFPIKYFIIFYMFIDHVKLTWRHLKQAVFAIYTVLHNLTNRKYLTLHLICKFGFDSNLDKIKAKMMEWKNMSSCVSITHVLSLRNMYLEH